MEKVRFSTNKKHRGVSAAEAIIAIAVFLIVVSFLVTRLFSAHVFIADIRSRETAIFLASEGLEAVRSIRDADFLRLSEGNYGIQKTGGSWQFSGSSDQVEGMFDRVVQISNIDQNTREVVSTVMWNGTLGSSQVTLSERLTNWRAISGWGNPKVRSCADFPGGQDGIKTQIRGSYAFGLQDSASSEFLVVDVSNPGSLSVVQTVSLSSSPRNIALSNNYAFIASTNNSEELQAVDVTNPLTSNKTGVYNASGNADALGVEISGSTAYLVRASSSADEFLAINISNPASPSLRGSLNLNSSGREAAVVGNYVYVATNDSSGELKVVNVANPSSPSIAGSYNISGSIILNTIAGFNSTVLAGGSNGTLYVFDVSNPASIVLRGQFSAGASINDIALGSGNTFALLATSFAAKEFQVVNILDPTSPTLSGGADMGDALNGVAYDANRDIAVTVGNSNTEEFCLLSP